MVAGWDDKSIPFFYRWRSGSWFRLIYDFVFAGNEQKKGQYERGVFQNSDFVKCKENLPVDFVCRGIMLSPLANSWFI